MSEEGPAQSSAALLFKPAPELTPRLGSRDLFGGLEPLTYMNHAGISPPSILVKKAIGSWLADYQKRGAAAYPAWAAQRDRLRGKLAKLVGARSPDQIALTQNTTRGISDIALCLDFQAGDRVVLFEGEFPSNVTPWLRAQELFGLEVTMLDGRRLLGAEDEVMSELEAVLTAGKVRLVAISAVQFQTGLATPLAEIAAACRRHGALCFVDAVQAMGLVGLDVAATGIDFIACGAHKWLMGVEGAGFVYCSDEGLRRLHPRVAGWLSHEEPVGFLFEGPDRLRYDRPIRGDIRFLEGGNLSATAFAALEASLDAILEIGVSAIFDHVQAIHDAIEPRAVELGYRSLRSARPDRRSGTLGLLPPDGYDVISLHREIVRQGVACATPDGVLRFSPHWPNAIDEAEQVVLTLEHALTAVPRSA